MSAMIKKVIKFPLIIFYKLGLRFFGGLGLQKIWPLGLIRDWLSHAVRTYSRPESVVFYGQNIFLNKEDNQELSVWGEGHWAKKEIQLIESFLRPGDVALDIGANIGLMTLFMARAVGGEGRVYAFEPAPENVNLLEKNISLNNHKNVTVVPQAVSDKSGHLKLFLSDFNPGDHRIYNPEEKIKQADFHGSQAVYDKLIDKREVIEVPVTSIDDFLKNHPGLIAFIKMDVQGAEGGVIMGAVETLKKNLNIKLMTEFWPAGLKMYGLDSLDFLTSLESLGFHFYEIENFELKKSMSRDLLIQKYTVQNNRSTDLIITR